MSTSVYHINGIELLNQIKTQGARAFDQLFRELYPSLCVFADKYIGDEEAAKDVIGDLFLSLWRDKETLINVTDVASYLYIAAKYKSLNYIRDNQTAAKHKKNFENLSTGEAITIDQQIFETEKLRQLYAAVNELPVECKKVILLGLQGLSSSEIARQLGVTTAAVSNQKARAIRLLKLKVPVSMLILLHSLLNA